MKKILLYGVILITGLLLISPTNILAETTDIIHDAEHYILEAQHGEKWTKEDKEIDKKLVKLEKKLGFIHPIRIVGWLEVGLHLATKPLKWR